MVLPKHLRPRRRYLAVAIETWPDATLDRPSVQLAIDRTTSDLLGDAGRAAIEPEVIRFEFEAGSASVLVRVRRETVEPARAALACLTEIDGHPVRLQLLGVCGTIRSCEEKYIGERPIPGEERTVAFDGAHRRAHVRGGRVDVRVADAYVGATDLDLE